MPRGLERDQKVLMKFVLFETCFTQTKRDIRTSISKQKQVQGKPLFVREWCIAGVNAYLKNRAALCGKGYLVESKRSYQKMKTIL